MCTQRGHLRETYQYLEPNCGGLCSIRTPIGSGGKQDAISSTFSTTCEQTHGRVVVSVRGELNAGKTRTNETYNVKAALEIFVVALSQIQRQSRPIIALPLIFCLTFSENLLDLRQGLGHLLIALLFSLVSLVFAVVMPYWELGGFVGQGLRE